MIDNHRTQGEWIIQLMMAINCFYFKNSEKNCTMHTTSDNIEVMMGNETGKIIEDYFDSFLQRYKKGLEE